MGDVYKNFTPELYEAMYRVDEVEDGMRLDQYCATFLPSFSRQQIKKKIKDGDVKILDRPYPHKPSVKVYYKEQVEVKTFRGDLEDEYWNGEKIELQLDPDIIHEDENLLVISKPSYMATHPTGKHLFNCATVYFENKFKYDICTVHRLDRETSGVLLLAKNPKTAQYCCDLFERDLVSKCYLFIGHKRQDRTFPVTATERLGLLDDYVPRVFNHSFPEDSELGKHAKTTYFDIHQTDEYIIGLAFPKTGRQHQIRSHAAHHGFPLLGDKLYNGDSTVFMRFKDLKATKEDHDLMQLPRHALHALALKIPYPNKNEDIIFKAPIPEDFKMWLDKNIPDISISELEEKISEKIKEKFDE